MASPDTQLQVFDEPTAQVSQEQVWSNASLEIGMVVLSADTS